ncbi:Carbohydrate esterase 4 protein [Tulasnella sp. 330]|nr:Carbohydrate esterase 4 protein [Tulasnella sp. 330]KAG8879977.1 Carbohydrate esterase 4 protein [Tulasnella sp. 332]
MKLTFPIAALSATSIVMAAGNYTPDELAPIMSSCSVDKTIALSFNDGAWVYMYDIGKALEAAHGKGTFFVNGNNYECIYKDNGKRVRWLWDHGHQLSSLTWDHKSLPGQTIEAATAEISKVQEAFSRLLGSTSRFLRPPFGNIDENTQYVAHTQNVSLVTWDYDAGDSVPNANVQKIIAGFQTQFNKKPHSILASLLETSETTAHQVVPAVIKMAQAAGYRLVSVAGEETNIHV